eukprot:TRINITY_DN2320_c0_g2_i1.p1 TRINITY_DN2320_c0_g2~~TRINITY_DN2320_c0_g2_i1.p1  ORF type:complete len:360 (+),score=77.46 TRINITY_DN2320_c0_g2_i1:74-1153(+)
MFTNTISFISATPAAMPFQVVDVCESRSLIKTPSSASISSSNGSSSSSEKMVKVFDPINKQPYNLRYGGESTEVHYTEGLENMLTPGGASKRAFLCKKYQARQCRAQSKCHSIHADRKKIAALRQLNPVDKSVPVDITVLCEENRETFSVPIERVQQTEGLHELCRKLKGGKVGHGVTGILCREAEKTGCSQACKDIHIDSAYLRHVRSMWRMPCCNSSACHECTANPEFRKQQTPLLSGNRNWLTFKVAEGSKVTELGSEYISPTKGLFSLCESELDTKLNVPVNRICRLHQKKACKWGDQCSNIHICRVKLPAGSVRSHKVKKVQPAVVEVSKPEPCHLREIAALIGDLAQAGYNIA